MNARAVRVGLPPGSFVSTAWALGRNDSAAIVVALLFRAKDDEPWSLLTVFIQDDGTEAHEITPVKSACERAAIEGIRHEFTQVSIETGATLCETPVQRRSETTVPINARGGSA